MVECLIRKLERFTALSALDKRVLEVAARQTVRHFGPREDIRREGDRLLSVNVILDGWACRYRMLEDGRRQIMALLLPGDVWNLDVLVLQQLDHSVGTITSVTLAEIQPEVLQNIAATAPRVMQALRWSAAVAESTQREWTVNLGQRTASERLAHLLCELFLRLRSAGLGRANACELPLTQAELGEILGLSTVHVNRTLQDMRGSGLISLGGKALTIPDLHALQQAALFNANYLHLDDRQWHGDASSLGPSPSVRKA